MLRTRRWALPSGDEVVQHDLVEFLGLLDHGEMAGARHQRELGAGMSSAISLV
ncbi:hypothetical protein BH24CHL4_BH24CHL4_10620 [soil metagenome]